MRILIDGGGFVNKGAEAMLRTVQTELAGRFEASKFFIPQSRISPATSPYLERIKLKSFDTQLSLSERLVDYSYNLLSTPSKPLQRWRERDYWSGWNKILDNIDLTIDISGYRYHDKNHGAPQLASVRVPIAEKRNKPFVFMPQSWGPFEDKAKIRKLYTTIYGSSSLLFARDKQSRSYLANILNLEISKIDLAPDIAFLFKAAPREVGEQMAAKLGLGKEKRPRIAISPNMRIYERCEGYGGFNRYAQLLAEICMKLEAEGFEILLIPHEIDPENTIMDDRFLCEVIRLLTKGHDNIVAFTESTSAEEIKALLSTCDLLLGSRFHAIVAALSLHIPAIVIGWSHKYLELMSEVELQEYVFDYDNLEPAVLISSIKKLWSEKEAVHQKLATFVPKIQAGSIQVFDRLEELMHTKQAMR